MTVMVSLGSPPQSLGVSQGSYSFSDWAFILLFWKIAQVFSMTLLITAGLAIVAAAAFNSASSSMRADAPTESTGYDCNRYGDCQPWAIENGEKICIPEPVVP